jgi:hypothetical protein
VIGRAIFVDSRVLLLDVDLDGGVNGWNRFEHEVIEGVGRLQSYRFAEDRHQAFAVLGDLHDRISMLHDVLGNAPVYVYSADSEVALRVLSDYANRVKGFIRVGSTDADEVAVTIALTVLGDLRTMPAQVVVVGRGEDMDAVAARLSVYLDSGISFCVVGCGRLGVLEADAWRASESLGRGG